MILEGLALLLGATLLSGGNSKEKEEKKRLEKLERTRETRKKYYEDNNLNEQYKNIKRKIDNLLEEKEKYKELKFYINDFKVKKYTSKVENLRKEFIVFDDYFDIIEDYKEYFEKLNSLLLSEEEVKNLNKEYVEKELNENKEFFSNIDGKSLDEQQRKAIIIDEDNNLVVAGAGSGKTLTISGKVKYLVEKKNINPNDILLITFTRSVAEEMTERINKLGVKIKASTFHSLGLKISGYLENGQYKILEKPYKILSDRNIKNILSNSDETIDALLEYSSYYVKDNETVLDEKFKTKSDYLYTLNDLYTLKEKTKNNLYESILKFKALYYKKFKKIKGFSKEYCIDVLNRLPNTKMIVDLFKELEDKYFKFSEKELTDIKVFLDTMKDEYRNPKDFFEYLFLNEKLKTYNGDEVKSQEERSISNFLFLNGIKFEYEALYKNGEYIKPKNSYKTIRGYMPDFYLPDYDIYIEHFGVDKDMKAHQYTESENKKYEETMNWKRETHRLNGTDLIETYSYYQQEGILNKKLEEELIKRGVKFNPLSKEEKSLLLMINNNDDEFSEFCKLINTFLTLFKAKNLKKEDLSKFKIEGIEKNFYIIQKHFLFLKMFGVIYDYYNQKLKEKKLIDFNDMINKAIENLDNNSAEVIKKNNLNYKYIIIDEFQDTSISKFNLIKVIRDKIEKCKVLAVGDDWQSIYRFAGSDISIFTEFEKYFGKTEISFIEKTYRNSQELINIAQKFIMENENQISKNLKSDKSLNNPLVLRKIEKQNDKDEKVFKILKSIAKENPNKKREILILARNNYSFQQLDGKYFSVNDKKIKIEASNFINDEELKKLKYLKNIKLSIKTVHSSKGLEADEVILIDVDDDIVGFPNKITDDSVLRYVLSKADSFLYGEERRLFYVAITRTRNRCYILYDGMKPSCFIKELFVIKCEPSLLGEKRICKKCGSYMSKRTNSKTNEKFYGCYHYPKCDYTESL